MPSPRFKNFTQAELVEYLIKEKKIIKRSAITLAKLIHIFSKIKGQKS